ncbi:N-acetylneuraminate synthase family protein [Rhabdochromatium marinum]|uniref:N-acetylneuraminate synthase family protein n=1 Tax=Rhabdochromatium marinum TaxID=48729 RepID=UPI001F5B29E0|nr:N-acetylneuraminate synthase family protein [Rhabdochromatium marinum]
MHELYEIAHTPWDWHAPIIERANQLGLIAFSTPFDDTAVDFLESLDTPCYKNASFENADLPLIRKVAATGKPMIISTGMATLAELDETVRAARAAGCKDLILLKCTSTYPATPDNSHLNTIPHLRELFGAEVGLSDHTHGIGAGIAAVALGATVIEKHFTRHSAPAHATNRFSLNSSILAFIANIQREAG